MRIKDIQKEVHQLAVAQLFWQQPINIAEKLCLIHSEVSEALEAARSSGMGNIGEELADTVIRILDLAEHLNINLETEIRIKHGFNKTRPIRHGKLF